MVLASPPCSYSNASSFNTDKKAANVLPVPVGETIKTLFPDSINGHATFCAGVGSTKRSSNQRVTADFFSNGIGRKQTRDCSEVNAREQPGDQRDRGDSTVSARVKRS